MYLKSKKGDKLKDFLKHVSPQKYGNDPCQWPRFYACAVREDRAVAKCGIDSLECSYFNISVLTFPLPFCCS